MPGNNVDARWRASRMMPLLDMRGCPLGTSTWPLNYQMGENLPFGSLNDWNTFKRSRDIRIPTTFRATPLAAARSHDDRSLGKG